MNDSFETIKNILLEMRDLYASRCKTEIYDPNIQITERDIVADIRSSLIQFCNSKDYQVHCEIRPAPNDSVEPDEMRKLPRIDVVILQNNKNTSWFSAAKKLQNKYQKGLIEARFSSIPISFFNTAIEAKIQSNVSDAKKDIDTLKRLEEKNPNCNCFFVLFNARGRVRDHERILAYAKRKEVCIIEYTAQYQQ